MMDVEPDAGPSHSSRDVVAITPHRVLGEVCSYLMSSGLSKQTLFMLWLVVMVKSKWIYIALFL